MPLQCEETCNQWVCPNLICSKEGAQQGSCYWKIIPPGPTSSYLARRNQATGDEEVELSVMTDVSVMEETNAQIQGGVDDLNDLIEEAARDAEFDDDAEEVEEDDAPTDEALEPMIIED